MKALLGRSYSCALGTDFAEPQRAVCLLTSFHEVAGTAWLSQTVLGDALQAVVASTHASQRAHAQRHCTNHQDWSNMSLSIQFFEQVSKQQQQPPATHVRHVLVALGVPDFGGKAAAEAVLLQGRRVPRLHRVVVEAVPRAAATLLALLAWRNWAVTAWPEVLQPWRTSRWWLMPSLAGLTQSDNAGRSSASDKAAVGTKRPQLHSVNVCSVSAWVYCCTYAESHCPGSTNARLLSQ